MKKNKKWLVAFLMLSSVDNVAADIVEDAKNGLFGEVNKLFRHIQKNISKTSKELGRSAQESYYTAVGKAEIAAMAKQAGAFLEGLAWVHWGSDKSFPISEQSADAMHINLKKAVLAWKHALIDDGISKSSDTNVKILKEMGYKIVANEKNRTIIKQKSGDFEWLKSPWGWLPYSSKKSSIVSNAGGKEGKVIALDKINESISTGIVVPFIWIKENSTMEPLSRENFDRLVENNLNPFMDKPKNKDVDSIEEDSLAEDSEASEANIVSREVVTPVESSSTPTVASRVIDPAVVPKSVEPAVVAPLRSAGLEEEPLW